MDIQNKVNVKIIADHQDFIPKYQTQGSACADLMCNLSIDYQIIHPNELVVLDCGFSMEMPYGWEAQIRPRSGLSLKGLSVVNSPGIIDSDYRGRIKVALKNISEDKIIIQNKQRIAQISIHSVTQFNWIETDTINMTSRGSGGFGSTGQ